MTAKQSLGKQQQKQKTKTRHLKCLRFPSAINGRPILEALDMTRG